MNRFSVHELPLTGLKLVERQQRGDARGFLSRIFCAEEFAAAGWSKPVAQINLTLTKKSGTVRGLHFQAVPYTEMKLVSCIRGEIWDVAVDIRAGSKTFLHWHAEHLSTDNRRSLLIPEGFAHGFQTLVDDVELLYCHSEAYTARAERGLNVSDPMLQITWPLAITEISTKDEQQPLLDRSFHGVAL